MGLKDKDKKFIRRNHIKSYSSSAV